MTEASTGLNIAVLVKQVPAAGAVSVNHESRALDLGPERVTNTYDAYGIGTAIGLKERFGGSVTVITAGPPTAREILLRGLATGADEAVLIDLPGHNDIDSLRMARLLADQVTQRGFDLVIAGQSTEDIETGQVGLQVAELLGWPQITLVTHVDQVDGELHVSRDSEGTKEVLGVHPPAVLMVLTGRDEEQRHPTLRGMMAAKKKPIDVVPVAEPGESSPLTWTDPVAVERESSGVIIQDTAAPEAARQLVAWLREQKLI
jgi:electron transfer flavoprotein alpha/beta subunit